MEKNQVLATIGNKEITQVDVEKVLRSLDPQRAMQFYSEDGKKKLVEELVSQELFFVDAKNRKLDESADFLNEVEALKENLLKQYAINSLLQEISVSEEAVKEYFEKHQDKFVEPESVRASHILVEDEAVAETVLKEINEGLSFEEAAKKYSKCPSNAKGGDLGFFTKGKMVPEFEAAAFNMNEDEISQPVKTHFGSHIIKVLEKKATEARPFEAVRDQLAQQLLSLKQQEVYYNRVDELKTQYEVKYL